MFTCHVVYTCHSCRRRGIRAAGEDCVRARARGRTQSDHLPAADLNYPCHYSCQKIVCVRTRADAPALSRRRERAPPPPAKRREGAKTRRLTIRGQEARKRGAPRRAPPPPTGGERFAAKGHGKSPHRHARAILFLLSHGESISPSKNCFPVGQTGKHTQTTGEQRSPDAISPKEKRGQFP